MKLGVLIPCYNVAPSIEGVLREFSEDQLNRISTILVVNNNSEDSTREIVERVMGEDSLLSRKIHLINNRKNRGLGGSQKVGYRFFIDRDFSHFFIVHGDGQGSARKIASRFFTVLDQDPKVEVIWASRFLGDSKLKGYSLLRILGNHFFNALTHLLSGVPQSDAGTGILLYRVDTIRKFPFVELTDSFQFNPQLSLLLNGSQVRTREVPLDWGDSDSGSNVEVISYSWDLLKILIAYRVNKSLFGLSGAELFRGIRFFPRLRRA